MSLCVFVSKCVCARARVCVCVCLYINRQFLFAHMCVWSQFLTIDHRSENFKGPNIWIIWDCVWETHKESQRVRVCVCVCQRMPVFLSLFNDLAQWARTELGHSFLGHLASGTMPLRPQSEQTWRQTHKHTNTHTHTHTHTHTRLYAYTNPPPPLRSHTRIQVPHHRAPL